jgi:hypothetical protein
MQTGRFLQSRHGVHAWDTSIAQFSDSQTNDDYNQASIGINYCPLVRVLAVRQSAEEVTLVGDVSLFEIASD